MNKYYNPITVTNKALIEGTATSTK